MQDCRKLTPHLQPVLKTCICQSCAGGGVDHPLAHQLNLDSHWFQFSKNIPPWQTPPCTFLRLVLLHDVLTLSPCPRPLDLTTRHSARSEGCRRSRRSFEMKRSPPQCRDCSSRSSRAGPSSTCTSLAAGKKVFTKVFILFHLFKRSFGHAVQNLSIVPAKLRFKTFTFYYKTFKSNSKQRQRLARRQLLNRLLFWTGQKTI